MQDKCNENSIKRRAGELSDSACFGCPVFGAADISDDFMHYGVHYYVADGPGIPVRISG